jgi:hypothetical protein
LFSSFAVKVQVSDEYVTTGLIFVLYIFIMECAVYSIMYRGSVLDAVSTFKIVTLINICKVRKICYLQYMSKFCCGGCG